MRAWVAGACLGLAAGGPSAAAGAGGARAGEEQAVRLAKAELALADGREARARGLLAENLGEGLPLHLPSLRLLLRLALAGGDPEGARAVYGPLFGRFPLGAPGAGAGDGAGGAGGPPPSGEALALRRAVALAHLEAHEAGSFRGGGAAGRDALLLAEGLFEDCLRHGHEPAATNLHLGRVLAARRMHSGALGRFAASKELFREELGLPSGEGLESIDYLIAKSLVQSGLFDPARIYLWSVFTSRESPRSLKDVAAEYLRALEPAPLSLGAGWSRGRSSNVFRLDDAAEGGAAGPRDGAFGRSRVNVVANAASPGRGLGALFLLDLSRTDHAEREHRPFDDRSLTLLTALSSSRLGSALLRLTHSMTLGRDRQPGRFGTNYRHHSLEPRLVHNAGGGALGYHLSATRLDYARTGRRDSSLGGGVSYTPFFKGAWWSPSYSLRYASHDEHDVEGRLSDVTGSVTNSLSLAEGVTSFPTVSVTRRTGDDPAEAHVRTAATVNVGWRPRPRGLRGLALFAEAGWVRERAESGGRMTALAMSAGLNYHL